jgi:hypothetical protein
MKAGELTGFQKIVGEKSRCHSSTPVSANA